MKAIVLIIFLITSSCVNPFKKNPSSGGGDGGGSIPDSREINDYLNKETSNEIPKCSNLGIEDHLTVRKYPIIKNSGKNPWPDSYSQAIGDQFNKSYMKPLRNQKIKESDLVKIDCKGYNYATTEEKKKFWSLYMSAVAYPESALNPHTTYKEPPPDNTISAGLLQIDSASADRWCNDLKPDLGMKQSERFTTNQMLNSKINLQCGLIMMQRSTSGVLRKSDGRLSQARPDLEGSLFSDKRWYWKVLENNSKRYEVINWFKIHAKRQLPFCQRISHQVNLGKSDYNFSNEKKMESWPKIDCENLSITDKAICETKNNSPEFEDPENKTVKGSELNLGEKNTTKDESCNIVDDRARNPLKTKSAIPMNNEDIQSTEDANIMVK